MTRAVILPLAFAILAGASPVPQEPDTSERAVVSAGAAYVAEYQRQLTSILADELYTQEIVAQEPREAAMPRLRRLRSEVFFMFAAGRPDWMAIRDVQEADGQAIAGRPDLRDALRRLPLRETADEFKQHNSRFNIGRMFRNFNEPTLALLVLDGQHRGRFAFDRTRVERVDGTVVVTIAFREKERPTLIMDPRRGRVFSRGELAVEAGSGRIRRTVLGGTIEDLRFVLTTLYAPDGRLGLRVPAVFTEEYEHGTARGQDYEKILCEARYSNFRRFETSVRVK